jgi:PadR family transcriptional regulator, regulatory protein AphA
MSLPHAILALLSEEPMSGYDLKTTGFDQKVNHFWSADQAQIYRTLEKLETQSWVESRLEIQYAHPNRKVYSITADGRTELNRWLRELPALTVIREPFLIKLCSLY